MAGVERTFTTLAATNFGFVPKYLTITGRSSWTGFIYDDFSGNSTCFSTSEFIVGINVSSREIRSFVQGCNYESEYFDADNVF